MSNSLRIDQETVLNAMLANPAPQQDARSNLSSQAKSLLLQLQHNVRDLNVLLGLVLGRDLEDDVLLVLRNRLLADGLNELGHPRINVSITY